MKGYIELRTRFIGNDGSKTIKIHYLVVDAHTSYNLLLGKPSLNALGVIVSTPHLAMKFTSEDRNVIKIYKDSQRMLYD